MNDESRGAVAPKVSLGPARVIAAAVLCALAAGGCTSSVRYARDTREDQPLVRGEARASGFLAAREVGLGWPRWWLEWAGPDGARVAKASDAVDRSRRFLWWRGYGGAGELGDRAATTGPGKVIVHLDPLVVVVGPGPVTFQAAGTVEPRVSWREARDALAQGPLTREGDATLPHGYFYGTAVMYSPECVWFSPDLGVEPTPAEITPDGGRVIRAGQVTLTLKREGAFWRVSAAPSEVTTQGATKTE